ncbi:hypothetical protein [Parvibaculum sp.]|uniref:hypothetical protein n=1 Tax=Parvibaculum sp. TaxID=2024848 RepID=UPI001D6B905C|nr:hypothetical protein [Parvibaculum sp.]MBX3490871.1 hypothetical protein [Parvibaculum sp.]
MTDVTAEIGSRVGFWMRQEWPRDTAKLAARAFDASERTAEKWLAGALPSNAHMVAMMSRWGHRFVAFVYEPVVGTSLRPYALAQELKEMQGQLEALERKIANAAMDEPLRPVADEKERRQGLARS